MRKLRCDNGMLVPVTAELVREVRSRSPIGAKELYNAYRDNLDRQRSIDRALVRREMSKVYAHKQRCLLRRLRQGDKRCLMINCESPVIPM
mgnify:CR=1 FL=1